MPESSPLLAPAGFLNCGATDLRNQVILVVQRTVLGVAGCWAATLAPLYLPDASLILSVVAIKCLQTLPNVPWKAKSPPAGKHWPTDRLSIHKIVLWSTIFTQLPTWIYHRDQLHSWQRAPSDAVDERSFSCVLKATGVAIECFLLWAVFLHRCWLVQVSHSWQFLLPKLYPIGGWSQSGSLEMELMWGFIVFYLFLKVFINLIYLFGCVMS